MDKLKQYLLRRRADLDVDVPAGDAWDRIASKLADGSQAGGPAPRYRSSIPVLRYAAAACLIAFAGIGIWLVIKRPASDTARLNSPGIKTEDSVGRARAPIRDSESAASIAEAPKEEAASVAAGPQEAGKPTSPVRHKTRSRRPAQPYAEIDAIDKSYSSLIAMQLRKLRATPLYAENGAYFSFYTDQFKQMDQDERQVRDDIRTYGLTTGLLGQLINVYQQKLNVLKSLQTEIDKMNNKVRQKEAPSQKAEVHYLNI